MSSEKGYSVYIMASKSRTLYTGMTNDLQKRVFQHKNDLIAGFTMKYRIHRLVHYEQFTNVSTAITREKEIKGWSRAKKIRLIESENPLGKTWRSIGTTMCRPTSVSVTQRNRRGDYSRSLAALGMTPLLTAVGSNALRFPVAITAGPSLRSG